MIAEREVLAAPTVTTLTGQRAPVGPKARHQHITVTATREMPHNEVSALAPVTNGGTH